MTRKAFVLGPVDGWVVVLDQQSEQEDELAIALGRRLTFQLGTTALGVRNVHDESLSVRLFDAGRTVVELATPTRRGADAALLCRTLATEAIPEAVGRILGKRVTFAIQTHRKLVEALCLPSVAVGLGFHYARRGELARKAQGVALTATGGAAAETPGEFSTQGPDGAVDRTIIQLVERLPAHVQAEALRTIHGFVVPHAKHLAAEHERAARRSAFRVVDDDE